MHMYPVNGVAAQVGNDETAWSLRDANWVQVIVGGRSRALRAPVCSRDWAVGYSEALEPTRCTAPT